MGSLRAKKETQPVWVPAYKQKSAITHKRAFTSSSQSTHLNNSPPPQQTLNVVVEEDENEQHKTPPVSDSWVVSITERNSSTTINHKLIETFEAGGSFHSSQSTHQNNPPPPQQTLNVVVEEEDENEQHKTPPVSDSWVVSITKRLDQASQDNVATTWSVLCIYKVPHYLIEGDKRSYVPQIVSIGPYHHRRKRMRSMDRHKWRFLQLFLKRTEHNDVKIYLNALKKVEDRIRACYEGPIYFKSDEFVQMMLLDGCFILELFQGAAELEGFEKLGYPRNDPVFSMRGSMLHIIQRDLIMLENQLPLFVLDLLLGIQRGQPELKGLVSKLALTFFAPLTPMDDEPSMESSKGRLESSSFEPLSDLGSLHCLEVFRRELLRSGPDQPELRPARVADKRQQLQLINCLKVFRKGLSMFGPQPAGPQPAEPRPAEPRPDRVAYKRQQLQLIHCVTELREAGVKFKRRRSTDCFWDVKFKNGVLKIPRLLIDDGTKSLFLNLIAFEQCHLDCSSEITSYVIFMDNLINSPADVGYLHYCGIIEHCLGSDAEVADMFNRLCQEVVFDASDSYLLSTLSDEVNTYFNYKWNSWRANLKHNYFSNPWTIISLFAAVILLLLTLAQTIYTVYGYYRPRGN